MILIPSIDLQDGCCVRLKQGDFNDRSAYHDSPYERVQQYVEQGATRLHVVDLDGAQSGEMSQLALIRRLKRPEFVLQVGGGIRSLSTANACIDAGIDKLVVGSIAVSNPSLVETMIQQIGAQSIVLAFDVHVVDGVPYPAIQGWKTKTARSLWDWVSHYQGRGIQEVLCTDIACDGMMKGPHFSLYEDAKARFPGLHWQASGGIRGVEDLKQLKSLQLSGAILGRMLYETPFRLKDYSEENGDAG